MMPSRGDGARVTSHALDVGGAANHDPLATVNDAASCVVARLGCPQPLAANYDSYATVDDGSCLGVYPGCLDGEALNFNCTVRGTSPCTTAVPRATVHEADVCVYEPYPNPPPSPPPLADCWNCEVEHSVVVSFVAAGSVDDVNTSAIAMAFAASVSAARAGDAEGEEEGADGGVGLDWRDVEVSVEAASVIITVRLPASGGTHAESMRTALAPSLASAAAASSFLNLIVQSTPELRLEVVQHAAPPAPPPPVQPIVYILPSAIGGTLALMLLLWWCQRRRGRAAAAATTTTLAVLPVAPAKVAPHGGRSGVLLSADGPTGGPGDVARPPRWSQAPPPPGESMAGEVGGALTYRAGSDPSAEEAAGVGLQAGSTPGVEETTEEGASTLGEPTLDSSTGPAGR